MKKKLIFLISVFSVLSSCNSSLYKEYSFEQKNVRNLNFYFLNDTLGTFNVKYLCADTIKTIEQKFVYKKISNGIFSVKGIENQKNEPFIYVSQENLINCVKSRQSIGLEKIPVLRDEKILIYKKKLFWQKIHNQKAVSKITFTAKN